MKAGQRITVRDPLSDDFGVAGQHIDAKTVGATFCYNHSWAWRLLSALIYYVIAPLPVFLLGVAHGLRFSNRQALKPGCYIYFNHTHWLDAVLPYLLCFPKRAWVVAGPTAFSMPGVRHLAALLGGVPLNTSPDGKRAFRAFLSQQIARGGCVAIYPEAHEWPYFNGVRHFSQFSFTYPIRTNATVFGCLVSYRRRPILASRAPHLTATLSQPIEPTSWMSADDPKSQARDAVYQFMVDTAKATNSYAWVHYLTADGKAVSGR